MPGALARKYAEDEFPFERRVFSMSLNRCFVILLAACAAAFSLRAQTPAWIWHPNGGAQPADNEARYFRKVFTRGGGVKRAVLGIAADNHFTAYLNGKRVANGTGWEQLQQIDVTANIVAGTNTLAVEGRNDSGIAALLVRLEITGDDGKKQTVVTDTSWLAGAEKVARWPSRDFEPAGWVAARSLGELGVAPWGKITAAGVNKQRQQVSGGRPATPAESLTIAPGFKVELLRSAQSGEGSWVSMAVDPKGRLIVSPQGNEPMLRITLDAQGQIAKLEKMDVPVRAAMGLLYAFDSLYVNGQGPDGYHLYRLRDTNGDDQFDKVELLRKWNGNRGGTGEHGAHGIVLGPDQKLYVVCGNFVDVPEDILPSSPHRNYADDQVLPRAEDGNGFGTGRKPPGGYVLRMDADGRNAELFASGERNTYDIDFNPEGELFAFDSDMEWDWGTPWYRPVRVHHVVSAADHGFREGTAKWPAWYPDSLPPVLEIGVGSPTGVRFGTGARFPAKYQRAFYIMDWSYGRIIAVHLTPKGSSYSAQSENFVVGKPLNVTDMTIGPDGAFYFATGGRGTQSGLYRVSYVGSGDSTAPAGGTDALATQRSVRHRLEAFHGKQDAKAIETAWPLLNSDDRYLRYAARIAIESQPVDDWQDRALQERDVNASITALLALARYGSKDIQDKLIGCLGKLGGQQLSDEQTLEAVRVLEVCLARMGRPSDETAQKIVERLDPAFPSEDWRLNRELAQVLIYFEAPGIAKKCLDLVASAPSQEEQLHYIFHLRHLKTGWTMEDRQRYFAWFNRDRSQDKHPAQVEQWFADVGQKAHDGASFPKFIANIKKDAIATLGDAERVDLASLLNAQPAASRQPAKQRGFVREWKIADLEPALPQVGQGRNWARGKEVFTTAQCVACHRFGSEGGTVAPDITAAASKYSRRDILESILEPSKVISDQYQNITIVKKDDDELSGRLVEETPDKLVLLVNLLEPDKKTVVPKSEVRSRAAARLSGMPEGLVNIFTKEEILDLLAYIESGGNQKHAAFAK